MDGVFNINKPSGPTSFRIVSLIRRWSREKKVGHAGTLDPLACGVLPICIGKGTKLVPYIHEFSKIYRVVIELGLTTDTYDVSGKALSIKDPRHVTREMVEKALETFRGTIWQRPPPYSAVKLGGKALYSLARKGILVEAPPRKVTIYSLNILDWNCPLLTLEIECTTGTYVRSLAHELGERLGCGACVRETMRLKYGPFNMEEAVSPEELKAAFQEGRALQYLYPMDKVLDHFPPKKLTPAQERLMLSGTPFPPSPDEKPRYGERRRAYNRQGKFLGVLYFQGREWRIDRNLA